MKPSFFKNYLSLFGGGTTTYKMFFQREYWQPSISMPDRDLESFCIKRGVEYAVSGGFFVHLNILKENEMVGDPLGEIWVDGKKKKSHPFSSPWDKKRGSINISDSQIEINSLENLKTSPSDLLQAGPLLVLGGQPVDFQNEGFSKDSERFDSDITKERHPRAAIGVSEDFFLVFACDGRMPEESGMYLEEVACEMIKEGCDRALNLDGGEPVSFIFQNKKQNRSVNYLSLEIDKKDKVPSPSAILFKKRKE